MNIPPFTISGFAKLHNINEQIVRDSLEFCILSTSEEKEGEGLSEERGIYSVFLNYSFIQLIEHVNETLHLAKMGLLDTVGKLIIATLAVRFGWNGKSLN